MIRWTLAAVIFVVAGGFSYAVWPIVRSKCIERICVGKKLSDLTAYGPDVAAAVQRGDREINIDLRGRPLLTEVVMFRPPTPTPPLSEIAPVAELTIHRDENGTIDHVRLLQVFANGSILWAPHQQLALRNWLRANTGARAAYQEIDWQRRGVVEQVDRFHGIRTVMQVWPGSAGFASLKVDIGYLDRVPEPAK